MLTRLRIVALPLLALLIAPLVTSQTPPRRDPPAIDIRGYQKILQENRGSPLLVTFWATWCEPCRDEYPMINELAQQYAPKGLRVIGIDDDEEGDFILMRRFLVRYKPVFPNFRKTGDNAAFQHSVSPEWSGTMPATFFYSKDGRLIGHFFGAKDRDTFEVAIRTLLAMDASAPQSK